LCSPACVSLSTAVRPSIVEDRILEPYRAVGQPRTAGTGGGGGGVYVCACAGGGAGCGEEHPATSTAGITTATSARRAIFSATSDIRSSIVDSRPTQQSESESTNVDQGARVPPRRTNVGQCSPQPLKILLLPARG